MKYRRTDFTRTRRHVDARQAQRLSPTALEPLPVALTSEKDSCELISHETTLVVCPSRLAYFWHNPSQLEPDNVEAIHILQRLARQVSTCSVRVGGGHSMSYLYMTTTHIPCATYCIQTSCYEQQLAVTRAVSVFCNNNRSKHIHEPAHTHTFSFLRTQ